MGRRAALRACLLAWFFSVYPADIRHGFQPVAEFGPYTGPRGLVDCLKDTYEVELMSRGGLIAGLCWPKDVDGDREPERREEPGR